MSPPQTQHLSNAAPSHLWGFPRGQRRSGNLRGGFSYSFSTETSDYVNSFLCICPFPISLLSPILGLLLPHSHLSSVDCGSLLTGLQGSGFCPAFPPDWSPQELLTRACPRHRGVTLPRSNIFDSSYWLIHSYFPVWHSRPLLFGTECSRFYFPPDASTGQFQLS